MTFSKAELLFSSSHTPAQVGPPPSPPALGYHPIRLQAVFQAMPAPHTTVCPTLAVPPRTGATLLMPSRLPPGRPSWSPVRAIAPIPAIDTLIQMTVIITIITITVGAASKSSKRAELAGPTTSHTMRDMLGSLSTEVWAGMAARTELGMAEEDMAMVDIASIPPSLAA